MASESESVSEEVCSKGSQVESENGNEDRCFLQEYTKDGSVDRHGNPARKGKTGGRRAGMLILANQALAALAYGGVEVNLVLFLKRVMRQTNAEAANTYSLWMATTYLFSLFGAFLSDSYFGRYLSCLIFQVPLTVGLISLSLTTQLLLVKPHGCGTILQLCEPHSFAASAIFYVSIYLISLGNGATDPSLATFGADQFDEDDPDEKKSKTTFFGYYYVASNMGSLVAETLVVYVEDMGNYVLGFWISTSSILSALILFLSGSFRFRHFGPSGNPISRFSQVIVASFRNRKLEVPIKSERLHEVYETEGPNNGARRIHHTAGFSFLDRAAIVKAHQSPNPWRLCTVSQVEEVKCVLRLIPIWLCTIPSALVFIQTISLFVEQGAAMNTKVTDSFHIPPASMTAFDMVVSAIFIVFYDKLVLPLYEKIAGKELNPPSELVRIGVGLAISVVALITSGFVEQYRLRYADSNGKETSSVSIFWQTPQYLMVGVAEAIFYVAQMDFFSAQIPDGLKSLGMGLYMSSSAIGSYLSTLILTVVMKISTRNGELGWVPPNLNQGHLDRFFFLSSILVAVNLVIYVMVARRYQPVSFEQRAKRQEMKCSNNISTSIP